MKNKSKAGKVGVAKAVNVSGKKEWERKTEGTQADKSRNFGGRKPIHDHSKQSDHEIGELTEWEKASGHDPRVRKGSPIVG